jgi:hypothetical protein
LERVSFFVRLNVSLAALGEWAAPPRAKRSPAPETVFSALPTPGFIREEKVLVKNPGG